MVDVDLARAARLAVLAGALMVSAVLPLAAQIPADAPPGSAQLAGVATVIARLESVLGRSLVEQERARCLDAGRRAAAASRQRQVVFVHALADLFGLPAARIATLLAMPSTEPVVPNLLALDGIEALLGRPVTSDEWRRVEALDRERLNALEPVRAALARDLATATGLPPEAVATILPRAGT